MTVHNRRDTTVECIDRFYKCNHIEDYEIDFYMMDDGSTDRTSETVAQKFPQVKILHGDGNLYWNRGMYYCWKEAIKTHHDFYLWLNDDTMLFENALDILFYNYNKAGEFSIISGCCCDSEMKSKVTYGGWKRRKLISPNGELQPLKEMNGNCVLIPNCVVEKIGISDPYFQHQRGDVEYGYRCQKYNISTFTSSHFIAICKNHQQLPTCIDPQINYKKRINSINSPFGLQPKELFYLKKKYKGIVSAFLSLCFAYAKVLFPNLIK